MMKNLRRVIRRVMLWIGLMLIFVSQACEERRVVEQPVAGKTVEMAAPSPTTERPATSPNADGAADAGRESAPAGGSK